MGKGGDIFLIQGDEQLVEMGSRRTTRRICSRNSCHGTHICWRGIRSTLRSGCSRNTTVSSTGPGVRTRSVRLAAGAVDPKR